MLCEYVFKVRAETLLLFDGDCKSASVGYLLVAPVNGSLVVLSRVGGAMDGHGGCWGRWWWWWCGGVVITNGHSFSGILFEIYLLH